MFTYHEFTFCSGIDFGQVRSLLQVALFSCEGLWGCACVRLNCEYEADVVTREVRIETTTSIGEDLARIFTSLIIREFGETGFAVREVHNPDEPPDAFPEEAGVA